MLIYTRGGNMDAETKQKLLKIAIRMQWTAACAYDRISYDVPLAKFSEHNPHVNGIPILKERLQEVACA